MKGGWVKLYRELLDKPIWQLSTPNQRSVLIAILLLANHSENKWEWKGEPYKVKPGQFITSMDNLAKKSGKGITRQVVRGAMQRFIKFDFITIETTKANTLINIVNWASYQSEKLETTNDSTIGQPSDNQRTTTNKNDKNVKNEKNKDILSGKPDDVKNSQIDYANFFKWFNEQTGRKFKNVDGNRRMINGRLKDGYTKDDLATVVTFMSKKWKGTDQEQYLRPSTLFRPSKFEGYLNDAKKQYKSQITTKEDLFRQ